MMREMLGLFCLGLLATVLVGCTQFTPYRTITLGHDQTRERNVIAQEVACYSGRPVGELKPCAHKDGASAGAYAVQHRHYQFTDYHDDTDKTGELKPADYHMSFVEFDDQGWFADRKQMEALFATLHRLEADEKRRGNSGHLLLLLYAHGWKHNASQCDDNVICFSRLLERMDILEQKLQPRKMRRRVVGIYVGWRGLSLDAGVLSNITFWTRKAAAARVGQGGVTELLTRLNAYRSSRNQERDGDKTQLVITGHSFGGQVIYSALSHALMERGGRTIRAANAKNCDDIDESRVSPDGLNCYSTATSFGDLVVLVNPAFEGSQYEPLFHIATNRCYRANQRPVMMTVTSSGDWATRIVFPLGRKTSTLFERARSDEQQESILRTVGHAERYETHRLEWLGPPVKFGEEPDSAREEGDCGCPYLEPTAQFNWRRFKGRVESFLLPFQARPEENPLPAQRENNRRLYDTVYGPNVRLNGDMKYSANFPYLVVKADKEIIEDHNTIYSEPFVRFLHSFFLVHIANGRPFESDGCIKGKEIEFCPLDGLVPCEQSCRLADGRSCSGRNTEDLKGEIEPPIRVGVTKTR